MNDYLFTLEWLVGDAILEVNHFVEAQRWLISFKSGSFLNIDCLWRLRIDGCLEFTSMDHGRQYGLTTPFDAINSLHQKIGSTSISAVFVESGAADLRINFGPHIVLELIQDCSGFEAWQARNPSGTTVIALGSGELCA